MMEGVSDKWDSDGAGEGGCEQVDGARPEAILSAF